VGAATDLPPRPHPGRRSARGGVRML
jgi:hypothetical protein